MHAVLKASLAGLLTATATYAVAHEGEKTTIIKAVQEGDGSQALATPKCAGTPDVDVSDEKKDDGGAVKRSRILVCSDGTQAPESVQRLQRARDRIANDDQLSADTKAKALAAIDAVIARRTSATD